jgi:nucleoside-diphosphate-sugar epimerase
MADGLLSSHIASKQVSYFSMVTTQVFCISSLLSIWLGAHLASSLAFQLPNFRMPWNERSNNVPLTNSNVLQAGDTVAVIGASGNVGKLVALRLSDTYKVNAIVRDASNVMPFFADRNIELFEVDLLEELSNADSSSCPPSLSQALSKANAIVICTGTTAFPTKAWSRKDDREVSSDVIKALLESKFDVMGAMKLLSGKGLNTPQNVDDIGNKLIYNAWNNAVAVPQKRALLLSSIGVQRRTQMPFPILNFCGVLDAKASAEESLIDNAKIRGYKYTIIRPGQLFGGPYDNNYYLGTLFQLDKDSQTQDVKVGLGDELLGDTLRSTLAEVTAQVCEGNHALDMDFAVINDKGNAPSIEGIQNRLKALDSPVVE